MAVITGVCPVTSEKETITFSDTVPTRDTFDLQIPTPAYTWCDDGQVLSVTEGPRDDGTTTEIIQCCPTPGPQGPQGPQGPAGADGVDGQGVPVGGTTGQILAKVDGDDYDTHWIDPPQPLPAGGTTGQVLAKIDGDDYNVQWITPIDTAFTFAGKWSDGTSYVVDDVITHNNSSYVCIQNHTASENVNEPDLSLAQENKGLLDGLFEATGEFLGGLFGGDSPPANDPSPYWVLLSKGENEDKGILGGVFDWISNIDEWDVSDYLLAIAGAAGVYLAGQEILDLFDFDPDASPEYDIKFNGDNGYIGAFTEPSLQTVVSSICDRAGITNYDVSTLPNVTVNLTIRQQGNWKSLLTTLSQAYQFEIISRWNGTRELKFQPRQSTSVRTLTNRDIGFSLGFQGDTPYQGKRAQGTDLPRSVEISYYSKGYSQKYLSQVSYMRSYDEGQDVKITLPITLTDQEAKNLSDVLLMNSHIERNSYSFITTLEHIDLEAGDVVTLDEIGDVRITRVTSGREEGTLEFIATQAGINLGQSTPNAPVTPDVVETVTTLKASGLIPLDLPPLDDSDREPRIHFAVHNFGSTQDLNARIYRSKDGGANYELIGTSTTKSKWGKVATAIPAPADFHFIDETTTITVEMKEGTLSTVSELDFYNGANRCMVGQELIYFRDVNDLGNGTYELSYLMRGKQGTNVYMDSHQNNEMFVYIDDSLVEIPMEMVDRLITYKYKVVTVGMDINNAPARDFAPQFRNLFTWNVTNLTIVRDSGTGIFGARFLRRWKWDTDIIDGRASLPDDDIGGYLINVLDPNNDNIVATYQVSSPTWTYTSAQQVTDFGSQQTVLKISVVGISKNVGPGHATIGTYGI